MTLNKTLIEKLSSFKTFCLATSDEAGKVDCATVYFAYDDAGLLYFASSSDTLKCANLAKNPHVAAAVDDALQSGVQLRGTAKQLDGAEADKARGLILGRHPHVARFLQNPKVVYFRLTPDERFLINFAWGVDWRVKVG